MQFSQSHSLYRMFCGVTEQTFLAELGVADTKLVDYLSALLTKFIHRDAIFAVKSPRGKQLYQIAEMLVEAERQGYKPEQRREIYRHIGDFALFWTGVYPEVLETRKAREQQDSLINYFDQGKRSYYIASQYSETPSQAEEAPILRRLADEFEVCAYGLRKVREHWERARQAYLS